MKKYQNNLTSARDQELDQNLFADLALDGFYMYPERTVLDLAHSEKAVEIMAVMHAASFIFEEKLKLGKVKR